ncbi:MAG: YkgJ family cysteine cluster protein [Candidatus Aenigmarchaeota archaeon]|nr:YkgJ family cysteine cluster protein [Candidatus Aenigmarchaeota archaeon]
MAHEQPFPCADLIAEEVCAGDCCGIHTFDKKFYDNFKHSRKREIIGTQSDGQTIIIITKDGKCVFLDDNNACAIYDNRPDICKEYGRTAELPCPYVKPSGARRSEAGMRHMQRVINHDVDYKMEILGEKIQNAKTKPKRNPRSHTRRG